MTAALEVQDLEVSFETEEGRVYAVRGISFTIEESELVGVVGESGSGKSVTFLAAMGLLPKTATITGSIKVEGIEVVGRSPRELRAIRGEKAAMIFQDPLTALNPTKKIGKQLSEMISAHNKLSAQDTTDRVIELLDLVGIPNAAQRIRQYPHEFSGGMRQRVMIAIAIANNPRLLIADEPTTALDTTVQAQILEVIDDIRQRFGTAVAFITHDLGVVARIAQRAQVMYAGRLVEMASVDDLFAHPTHPYTQGLISSLPQLGSERLVPIPGAPPNMANPPSGCAFRPRCPYAADACASAPPDLVEVGDSRSACIRIGELDLAAV